MIDLSKISNQWNIIECNEIIPNIDKSFKDYNKFEIKRLIELRLIAEKIKFYCNKHNLYYDAIPFLISKKNVFYTQCPKCDEEKGKIEESVEEIRKKEIRKKEILKSRGVAERFFITNIDYSKGILNQHSYLLKEPLKKNLIIIGNTGCGKSTFGYELCKRYYDFNLIAVIENANYLVSRFKQNYSNIESFIREFTYTDLIIIDEIDNIKSIDFLIFDEIISFAYDSLKRICFIGNIKKETFFSLLSKKSISRFYNECIFIVGNDKDLRKE